VDHVGPWLIAGIAIAALVEPILHSDLLRRWPVGADVLLFAGVGMPLYVCASGATPLAAVLVANGASPGAALAFLLSGPATNITTFGVLSKIHGKRAALLFGAAILGLSIGLGLLTNLVIGEVRGTPSGEGHAHGWLHIGSLVVLTAVFAASVLRQGPRGFVGQVLDPYGHENEEHDHSHLHRHDGANEHGTKL
jgi:hypothetical protein